MTAGTSAVCREQAVGDASVPRLELREWAERFGVVAGITTRGHGFNLGLSTDETVGVVTNRWRAFRAALQPRFRAFVLSHQVHGTAVSWHDQHPQGWLIEDDRDGHATVSPGLLLMVTVADCVPVYLIAPEQGAMALLHAGWRGVAGRVLERGVEILKRQASAPASDIVMHCGVGICGDCYEVGPEVASRFAPAFAEGPHHVDLRAVLARQARELGIREISISPWCSAHDREQFLSHRASGGKDGRMVAHLGRPLA